MNHEQLLGFLKVVEWKIILYNKLMFCHILPTSKGLSPQCMLDMLLLLTLLQLAIPLPWHSGVSSGSWRLNLG